MLQSSSTPSNAARRKSSQTDPTGATSLAVGCVLCNRSCWRWRWDEERKKWSGGEEGEGRGEAHESRIRGVNLSRGEKCAKLVCAKLNGPRTFLRKSREVCNDALDFTMAPKGKSQSNSKAASRVQSGANTPVVLEPQVPLTTVIGINFGQSFSSIAVINKVCSSTCGAHPAMKLTFSPTHAGGTRRLHRQRRRRATNRERALVQWHRGGSWPVSDTTTREGAHCVSFRSTREFRLAFSSFATRRTPSWASATSLERRASGGASQRVKADSQRVRTAATTRSRT